MLRPSPAFWIVIGLILAALEMVVPGFVILWFGVAAVLTGVVAFFVHNPLAQLGVFAGLSAVLVTASQLISRRMTKAEPEAVGANRLRGVEGLVVEDIVPPEMGRVKVLGEEWRAESGSAIARGAKVRITGVSGTHLEVERADERSQ
jgi:membrane protein implicated in regulation of membrane protease activity